MFGLHHLFRFVSTILAQRALKKEEAPRPTEPEPTLGEQALQHAILEVGKGEDRKLGNNRGADVVRYRGNGIDDRGAWCADFVYYCFQMAALTLLSSTNAVPFKRSRSAKGLARNAAKVGRVLPRGERPRAGDIGLYERGLDGDWMGHIVFVESADATGYSTIEGNVGKVPALVKRKRHRYGADRFIRFVRV